MGVTAKTRAAEFGWFGALALGAVGLVALALGGCASTVRLTPAPQIGGAYGTVQAMSPQYGDTRVSLKVENLAQPELLVPGTQVFVVWARDPASNTIFNLGVLNLADNATAAIETATPLRVFEVTVTPERSPEAVMPSNPAVLSAFVSSKNK
jgi:hypothetical protein